MTKGGKKNMSDDNFEKELSRIALEHLNNLMDSIAEMTAKNLAKEVIDSVEETLTEPELVERKPLIYLKIIEELQKYVDKMSGEVKVE